jgi:hypothetical protein
MNQAIPQKRGSKIKASSLKKRAIEPEPKNSR